MALFSSSTLTEGKVGGHVTKKQREKRRSAPAAYGLRFARGCAASYTFARWPKSRCV